MSSIRRYLFIFFPKLELFCKYVVNLPFITERHSYHCTINTSFVQVIRIYKTHKFSFFSFSLLLVAETILLLGQSGHLYHVGYHRLIAYKYVMIILNIAFHVFRGMKPGV